MCQYMTLPKLIVTPYRAICIFIILLALILVGNCYGFNVHFNSNPSAAGQGAMGNNAKPSNVKFLVELQEAKTLEQLEAVYIEHDVATADTDMKKQYYKRLSEVMKNE